ncbi:MAG: T9SS C-terminal target domain-containing protein [Candidatus Latescibacterota bacterium]|nr:MAG: T9SS C-terminal target domain-containing protein [Candidatus Latescibacterota bacterium]
MISRRRLLLSSAALALFFVQAAPSSAQVSPADMRSGCLRVTTGATPVVIFTVPAGQVFVLTDLEWSTVANAGDASPISLNLYGDATERWRARGAYQYAATGSFQPPMIQSHFTTGIVFQPGEVVTFESGSQLAARSYALNWSGYVASSVSTAVSGANAPVPPAMQMKQNAPNPFNPETKISYELDAATEAELRVFDSSGRLVRTLVSGQQDAGEYSIVWDGTSDDGRSLASGVYFYELSTDRGRESRKAVMVR